MHSPSRIGRRVWLLFTPLCALLACKGGREEPKPDELREVVLREPAPEQSGGELFAGASHTHRELLDRIGEAAREPRIRGVFLRLGGLGGAFARSSELQEALLAVRAADKPVHCHFEQTDNGGYALLSRVCDRISMTPNGLLALTGVRAQSLYARELLKQVGLEAELLQVGRYKGAADTFTRADMPPEVRETLGALLDDLQAELGAAVSDGRKLDAEGLRRAIDEGPHTARSALALRLIDAIAFDDEARARAKSAASAKSVAVAFEEDEQQSLSVGEVFDLLFGDGDEDGRSDKRVVLAYLDGTIRDGEQEGTDGVNSGPFVKAMRRIADDEKVLSLVLRVDSPGGSALASEKMWHALKRVAKRKPVIVSIGDMAASGGYYVACAGDEIFAQNSSIVGSIGVVGGKIVGAELAERLGVRSTALARGKNANWFSPFSRFSESERSAIMRALEETYATFLNRVSEGRKLSGDKLTQVAEGRIMSGRRAQAGGLVDRTGGLQEALARARSKASLPADSAIEIWPRQRTFLQRMSTALSGASEQTQLAERLLPSAGELARHPLTTLLVSRHAGPMAVLPLALQLE